ncbi:MAG: S46 family peptidase [Chlorobi bacterium]|nr:S46 family peptidase [Chlorobiota bacterium]
MLKKRLLGVIIILFATIASQADEGMWIPMLLNKYNIEDMQKKGFKLTAEDIYSINHTSMKDAVVLFGRGCTGELISDEGLIITNHHCGFSAIQSHSSLEHDYLTDGFWAKTNDEELPNPGLQVRILVKMEDVTDSVLFNITDKMTEEERQNSITKSISKIKKLASEGNNYDILVKPFFYGNQYFLIEYEVFNDIRLVGAPPSSIGKFGGDTDNWMWPRHTGDFSIFRVYVNNDNKPAKYSKDNVPYKPKYHFPISLQGVKKDDFTMVYGFPGRTSEYLTSYAVNLISKVENPKQIELRAERLKIMVKEMDANDEVRIQYASKYARVSNYWKKWIGENKGLQKLGAIEKKQQFENEFTNWVNSSEERKEKYGKVLTDLKDLYTQIEPYKLTIDYMYEAVYAVELLKFASKFNVLVNYYNQKIPEEELKTKLERLKKVTTSFYKDYYLPIDKNSFVKLMQSYNENIPEQFQPQLFKQLVNAKYKGNYNDFADYLYNKSIFSNKEKTLKFLENYKLSNVKKLIKDPAYALYASFAKNADENIYPNYLKLKDRITRLNRIYLNGMREMQPDKIFYPDANSTLRVAYGKVDDYYPRDAVHYDYYTTLSGIIEKDNPDIYDYKVPDKLKNLYYSKNYGQYGQDSTMHICFTATNHTTGGNSGSPVLNDKGQLIGVNFDRNWEGTMSDIMYDPNQCRNIILDIRYALFIIDKFAGDKRLIDEMTIVK